jgi:integrase
MLHDNKGGEILNNRIKLLRTEKGLKQIDLAKHLNVAQSTLSGWETGNFEIDNENLKKLADLFGCSIDYILFRITLNQIFKAAIADKITDCNPVLSTKVIAPDKPKRKCLSPIQRDIMLKILEGERFYPILMMILYTGMRMGEALALLWDDIDFDNKIIRVYKALEFRNSQPEEKGPKSEKGYRDIPIPEELFDYLTEYKKSINSDYVFPNHNNTQMTLTQIKRRLRNANKTIETWFDDEDNKDFKQYKINLNFRLLRHTYCTGLYDANIDDVSAAEIMGHDVVIMKEIYTHIQDARRNKTVAKLDNIYKK